MKEFLESIWGQGRELTAVQVGVRAIVMFFVALLLVRLGGVRMFGKKSAIDKIAAVMLGAILSRGVMGASPFGVTVMAGTCLVLVHRGIAFICIRSRFLARIINGEPIILFKDGVFYHDRMQRCSLSEQDLFESLRLHTGKSALDGIQTICMEPSGRISFIMGKKLPDFEKT